MEVIRLTSGALRAEILPVGASLWKFLVPDLRGDLRNIVLSLPSPVDYLNNPAYVGCTVGRVAGRIADGVLVGHREHHLLRNEGANTLHGGPHGWSSRTWEVESATEQWVTMRLTSPDGDQGFPGCVKVLCSYQLSEVGLDIEYSATSDAATVINITHHPYWNLSGDGSAITNHCLQIMADEYAEAKSDLTLTGMLRPVDGTIYDFRTEVRLDKVALQKLDTALILVRIGADAQAARLRSEVSGIDLRLSTDQKCIQLYAGGALNHEASAPFGQFSGLCLEPHGIPWRPGLPWGGLPLLNPGETYRNRISWRVNLA